MQMETKTIKMAEVKVGMMVFVEGFIFKATRIRKEFRGKGIEEHPNCPTCGSIGISDGPAQEVTVWDSGKQAFHCINKACAIIFHVKTNCTYFAGKATAHSRNDSIRGTRYDEGKWADYGGIDTMNTTILLQQCCNCAHAGKLANGHLICSLPVMEMKPSKAGDSCSNFSTDIARKEA